MEKALLFRRQPSTFDAELLNDPGKGLMVARAMWEQKKFELAMDLYDQMAQLHRKHAVAILAEAYDKLQEINPRTRYHLYQSRFFNFPIKPGDKVLDIGSGHMPFPLATHLADISLTDGRIGRLGVPFKHVDGKPTYEVRVEDTGFEDKQFDFVYCSHVLEHSDDPEQACRELSRIGKRGYIETPTKGKDTFLGSALSSNHRWHVEFSYDSLIFTEYEERDLAGFGVGILMNMHTKPQTLREKAFSALIYLRADQCNTMLGWEDSINCEVHSNPNPISFPYSKPEQSLAPSDEYVTSLASRIAESVKEESTSQTMTQLIEEILTVLNTLVEKEKWDQAMLLTSAAKKLPTPVYNLNLLRAIVFHSKGLTAKARQALEEETQNFPANKQAMQFLQAINKSIGTP